MATKKKPKAYAVMSPGCVLRWLTDQDRELARNIPNGSVVSVEMRRNDRNLSHHRKAFALLKLGFEYWTPAYEFVSKGERWAAHRVAKMIAEQSGDPSLYDKVTAAMAEQVMQEMTVARQSRFDPEQIRTPEQFRGKMLIDAGYYDVVTLPDGGTYKRPRSMSFMSMSQQEFNDCYKALFKAVWNAVLKHNFDDEQQVNNAIAQMENFI